MKFNAFYNMIGALDHIYYYLLENYPFCYSKMNILFILNSNIINPTYSMNHKIIISAIILAAITTTLYIQHTKPT